MKRSHDHLEILPIKISPFRDHAYEKLLQSCRQPAYEISHKRSGILHIKNSHNRLGMKSSHNHVDILVMKISHKRSEILPMKSSHNSLGILLMKSSHHVDNLPMKSLTSVQRSCI
jgi:hypothetical protein